MSLFLTPSDLAELTGRKRAGAQRRALQAMGIAFVQDPEGRPRVLRVLVDGSATPLEAGEPVTDDQTPEYVSPPQWWDGSNWQDYILDPRAKEFHKDWREAANVGGGLYALWSPTELLYVGKAASIGGRIKAHMKKRDLRMPDSIPFTEFTYVLVPDEARLEAEVAHIWALKPPCNRLYEQAIWKGHPFMVDAIRLAWSVLLEETPCS